MPITLPEGFEYVSVPLVSLGWVLLWQTILVIGARKHAAIKYPQMYAEQEECKSNPAALRFNCTQRAHQNTLEAVPIFILGTIITGLKYPCVATALGSGFVVGRVIYTLGYRTGKPGRRVPGLWIGNIASLGLLGAAAYTSLKLCSFL
ncbi:hypothetical protein SCLCIDRAFT_19262 [Scleroderma citrinum Foug A]|uniref:Uncharacterized protein n=1 Tax=Scleroderma citrinum Foug A TaxID=1036808 RepID=A0A0C3ERB0_9AGAM|nr:hypothetical protein SCLCIDRAFT_19262 [Scleroderma citrinum Foug A]